MTRGDHHLVTGPGPDARERTPDVTGADDADPELLALRRYGHAYREWHGSKNRGRADYFQEVTTMKIRNAGLLHVGLRDPIESGESTAPPGSRGIADQAATCSTTSRTPRQPSRRSRPIRASATSRKC